jgi:zinc transporter 1/2/3
MMPATTILSLYAALAVRSARRTCFFLALSVHSVFDGLSIGSEGTVKGFYSLLFAVVGHKLLDGFALGVPLYFAKLPKGHTIFALVFCALMTPIGIVIGKAATTELEGRQAQLSRGIFLSLSAGSFVFISIVELLPAGLMDGKYLLWKMLVTSIGWGIMAMLAIWV